MTAQKEIAIKLQMKDEQRQLFFRKLSDSDDTERVISSMNAARRSMGITEIQ
jgi:hypothetical protein